MESFFSHPAIQSGIIPFVVALVLIPVLTKIKPVLVGLSAIAVFAVTVGMVMGYGLTPFSSTQKIVLLAYLAALLGLIADLSEEKWIAYHRAIQAALALIFAIAMLWVIWPVVSREGSQNSITISVGLCAYVAWMVLGTQFLHFKKVQLGAAVFSLSMGTALVSILGATALYGQLAAPFAAATGAWLLYCLFASQRAVLPISFALTATATCAVLGAAATVYASLNWLVLVLFALIPLVVHIPSKQDNPIWLQLLKSSIAAIIPVLAAIWYTVQQSADSGYYG